MGRKHIRAAGKIVAAVVATAPFAMADDLRVVVDSPGQPHPYMFFPGQIVDVGGLRMAPLGQSYSMPGAHLVGNSIHSGSFSVQAKPIGHGAAVISGTGTFTLAGGAAGFLGGETDLTGTVDIRDLFNLALHYNNPSNWTWADGDFNYDGKVSTADLQLLVKDWMQGSSQINAMPIASGAQLDLKNNSMIIDYSGGGNQNLLNNIRSMLSRSTGAFGNGGLVKVGSGSLLLEGPNNSTGSVTVNSGTLEIGGAGVSGGTVTFGNPNVSTILLGGGSTSMIDWTGSGTTDSSTLSGYTSDPSTSVRTATHVTAIDPTPSLIAVPSDLALPSGNVPEPAIGACIFILSTGMLARRHRRGSSAQK